jgi:hypothetical protein
MKALFDYNRYVTRSSKPGAKRQFHLVMIKPSHYDDNGYVIQWIRSAIPSNTTLHDSHFSRFQSAPDGKCVFGVVSE